MTQKINMAKKKFRIGELAKELQVKKFVIRFWEKEFGLKSDRSQGGQRYYTQDDFKAFNTIKHLLYKQGYTIAGAKSQLATLLSKKHPCTPQENTPPEEKQIKAQPSMKAATKIIEKKIRYIPPEFLEQVGVLKAKLLELKQVLD